MSFKDLLVKVFFRDQVKQATDLLFKQYKEKEDKRLTDIKNSAVYDLVGVPVIAISNEWANPVIGRVIRPVPISKSGDCVPQIYDVISGQPVIAMGKVIPFTMQRFEALFKLDPNERCSLLYSYTNCFEKTGDKLLTRDKVYEILIRRNFIDLVNQYWSLKRSSIL